MMARALLDERRGHEYPVDAHREAELRVVRRFVPELIAPVGNIPLEPSDQLPQGSLMVREKLLEPRGRWGNEVVGGFKLGIEPRADSCLVVGVRVLLRRMLGISPCRPIDAECDAQSLDLPGGGILLRLR